MLPFWLGPFHTRFQAPPPPPGLYGCLTLPAHPGGTCTVVVSKAERCFTTGQADSSSPPLKAMRELLTRGGEYGEPADHVEQVFLVYEVSDGTAVTRRGGRCERREDEGRGSGFPGLDRV